MSKSAELGQSLMIFALLIGVCVWVGTIVATRGEARLEAACRPIEYSTNLLHEVSTAITGAQTEWTLQTQRYAMGGCYYFFTLVLTPLTQQGESGTPVGGMRGDGV